MSLLKIIVIGDNIEKQMAPFKEIEISYYWNEDAETYAQYEAKYDAVNDILNANAKWDWWSAWKVEEHETSIPLKNGGEVASALIQNVDIDKITCWAIIYNGEWLEKGKMGWWGESDTTNKSENEFFLKMRNILKSLPNNTKITLIEGHI